MDRAYKEYKRRFDKADKQYTEAWDAACKRLNKPAGSALPKDISEGLDKHYADEIARTEEAYDDAKNDCFKLHQ